MAGDTETVEPLDVTPLLRFAALAGALSFLALLVGLRVGDVVGREEVEPTLPEGLLTERLQENVGEVRAGAALCALAAVFAVFFAGALWAHVRRAADWLGVVAAGAGVLLAVQLLALADRGYELADLADLNDDGTARALLATSGSAMRYLAVPVLVLAAVIAFGHRRAPGWFRGASIVVLVLLPVVLAPFDAPPGLALAGGAWMLLASLVFGLGDFFPSDE